MFEDPTFHKTLNMAIFLEVTQFPQTQKHSRKLLLIQRSAIADTSKAFYNCLNVELSFLRIKILPQACTLY